MTQQLNPVLEWLNNCRDQVIRIEKRETDDLDVTELRMEEVDFTDHTRGSADDDYIAPQEILLKGEGWVQSREEQPPLPNNCYEIPLIGQWGATCQEQAMTIQTERASYVVTKA